MNIKKAYTYDDVLLVPRFSKIRSRETGVDVSRTTSFAKFDNPIMPANMKDIASDKMIEYFLDSGSLVFPHRFHSDNVDYQIRLCKTYHRHVVRLHLGCTIGVKPEDYYNFEQFYNAGYRVVCIDIAHGDSQMCVEMISRIHQKYPHVKIVAGNIVTPSAAIRLWEAGATIVKVGVGPGSICTTRKETGNGYPQLSALFEINKVRHEVESRLGRECYIIADGGIKEPGDVVKALCYADFVMIGGMFSSCPEAAGDIKVINDVAYKEYAGSSTLKDRNVEGTVLLKKIGPHVDVVCKNILAGLKSGLAYQGANSLQQFSNINHEFVEVSHVQSNLDHNKTTYYNRSEQGLLKG